MPALVPPDKLPASPSTNLCKYLDRHEYCPIPRRGISPTHDTLQFILIVLLASWPALDTALIALSRNCMDACEGADGGACVVPCASASWVRLISLRLLVYLAKPGRPSQISSE